jgi:hypothetical protein
MATVLAFCTKCGKNVSAHTLLNDKDLLGLDRNAEMKIGHVIVDNPVAGNSEDHIWSLSDREREVLRDQLASSAA